MAITQEAGMDRRRVTAKVEKARSPAGATLVGRVGIQQRLTPGHGAIACKLRTFSTLNDELKRT